MFSPASFPFSAQTSAEADAMESRRYGKCRDGCEINSFMSLFQYNNVEAIIS